jgi:hypothetical protein
MLEPWREVADLEEDNDPIRFGATIGMETARFIGGGRPALQRAITSS